MKPAKITRQLSAPQEWQQLCWGESYRLDLEGQIRPWLGKIFGNHFLKIGQLSTAINTEACAITHQISLAPQGEAIHVKATPLHLPFLSKSIDACLLAQTLSWCADPHAVLREVDRVLIDDGWLILSEFSPVSVLGLGKLVPLVRKKPPFDSRLFTAWRLLDWLALLNYEIIYRRGTQVLPWHRQGGRILSTHFPALGTQHMIVARKRTLPLTLNPLKNRKIKSSLQSAVGATRQVSESAMPKDVQPDSRHPHR